MQHDDTESEKLQDLADKIKAWGEALGFQQVAIVEPDLSQASARLNKWLADGFQGSMQWMGEHGDKRYKVDKLVDHTLRVISVRMDYLADNNMIAVLKNDNKAYISRYALGRDYHKLIRKRLARLVTMIEQELPQLELSQRPFVDSAPVMENHWQSRQGWAGLAKTPCYSMMKQALGFFLARFTPQCRCQPTAARRAIAAITAAPA